MTPLASSVPEWFTVKHMKSHTSTVLQDAGRVRAVRSPARFSRTEPELWRHAPDLGQHTDEILGEFGFGAGEIAELKANRIVN